MVLTQRCVIQAVNVLGKSVLKNSCVNSFIGGKAFGTKRPLYPRQLTSKPCAGRWMLHSKSMLVAPPTENPSKTKQIHSASHLRKGPSFQESESPAYEGSGKTTVTILNEDVQFVLVDAFSLWGFRTNSGLKAYGPIVVFPNAVLSWRVMDILEVNERSLSLFTMLEPKPEIVFVGYGDRPVPIVRSATLDYEMKKDERDKVKENNKAEAIRQKAVANHIAKLTLLMQKQKLNVEILPTEDAIASYNYLVAEDRLVAAALIPPNSVKLTSRETEFTGQLAHGEDPWVVERSEMFGAGEHGVWKDFKKRLE